MRNFLIASVQFPKRKCLTRVSLHQDRLEMEMKRIRRWGKTVVGDLVVGKIGAASSSEVNSLGNYLEKEAEEKRTFS